jgi:ribulose-5-phosphate 4-epimerase/fuculose-1-phosphate aldolase
VTATLQEQLEDLVIANRILARQEVVDGFGHISMRHPERADRFFMSRSRSPELVVLDDIMEFDLDCNPIDQRGCTMYGERPIHGAIYRRRPGSPPAVKAAIRQTFSSETRRYQSKYAAAIRRIA